jgi:hypothetical protein
MPLCGNLVTLDAQSGSQSATMLDNLNVEVSSVAVATACSRPKRVCRDDDNPAFEEMRSP